MMNLQKRLAGKVLKCSPSRIILSVDREEVQGAITRGMIRGLVKKGVIVKLPARGTSRGHARHIRSQKLKGRRLGMGSRRGTAGARTPRKETWMNTIRSQREFLSSLKKRSAISQENYLDLYKKSKGGFFRSQRHIYIYLKERGMLS